MREFDFDQFPGLKEELKHYTHDGYFKMQFSNPRIVRSFLYWKLPLELQPYLNFDGLEHVDTESVDEQFRSSFSDMVYRVPFRDAERYLYCTFIFEHKSYNDRLAIYQIMKYVMGALEGHFGDETTRGKQFSFPPVVTFLVHHGERPFSGATELRELFNAPACFQDFSPSLRAILVDFAEMREDDYPWQDPLLLLFVLAMHVVFAKEPQKIVLQFLSQFQPYVKDPLFRRAWYQLLVYIRNSSKHLKRAQMEEIMSQSKALEFDPAESGIIQHMIEVEDRGIEKGREEGIEALIQNLLIFLEIKYKMGEGVYRGKLQQVDSYEKLNALFEVLCLNDCLDEFDEKLDLFIRPTN